MSLLRTRSRNIIELKKSSVERAWVWRIELAGEWTVGKLHFVRQRQPAGNSTSNSNSNPACRLSFFPLSAPHTTRSDPQCPWHPPPYPVSPPRPPHAAPSSSPPTPPRPRRCSPPSTTSTSGRPLPVSRVSGDGSSGDATGYAGGRSSRVRTTRRRRWARSIRV